MHSVNVTQMNYVTSVAKRDALGANRYATGTVTDTSAGSPYVGGLVGNNSGTISNSYATGNVSVSGRDYSYAYNGGLVGNNSGSITGCYATGSVSGNIAYNGGLVGYSYNLSGCSITDCYATGGSVSGNYMTGGLVGYNQSSITRCYATGRVRSINFNGELVGYNAGSIDSSYWDTTTEPPGGGVSQNSGTISSSSSGEPTAAMQTESTFDATWVFTPSANPTWGINNGYTYPYLLGVTQPATINPNNPTFDLNTGDTTYNADVPVSVTLPNGYNLTDIKNGSTPLIHGNDYTTVSGSVYTVTLLKSYLANQSVGTTTLTFDFSAGAPATLTITVENTTVQNSTINPPTATFDLNTGDTTDNANVPVTVTLNGNTLTDIKNGTTTLTPTTDYTTVSDSSTVTILKSYLATQSVGTTTLTFDFSAGAPATLAVTVENTTVQNSTGGGGLSTPQPVTSTTGSASVPPSAGGIDEKRPG